MTATYSGSKNKPSKKPALLATCFTLASCLAYSSTLNMEAACSSETSADFNGLLGVISQKREIFLNFLLNVSLLFSKMLNKKVLKRNAAANSVMSLIIYKFFRRNRKETMFRGAVLTGNFSGRRVWRADVQRYSGAALYHDTFCDTLSNSGSTRLIPTLNIKNTVVTIYTSQLTIKRQNFFKQHIYLFPLILRIKND
jgi:hypothetical protein